MYTDAISKQTQSRYCLFSNVYPHNEAEVLGGADSLLYNLYRRMHASRVLFSARRLLLGLISLLLLRSLRSGDESAVISVKLPPAVSLPQLTRMHAGLSLGVHCHLPVRAGVRAHTWCTRYYNQRSTNDQGFSIDCLGDGRTQEQGSTTD